jgi:hypothetical protein
MKQITVRLADCHRINGDTIEVLQRADRQFLGKTEEEYNDEKFWTEERWDFVPTAIKIGAKFVVISIDDVSPNNIRSRKIKTRYELHTGPVGGNSNRKITRYHGWRGTTDDNSVYAHGLRRVLKIRQLKNGQIAVVMGNDILPDNP